MITDLLDRHAAKVLTLFSISPGSRFTRNEIKDKTLLNNVTLDASLNVLLANDILTREKRLYALNFENEAAKTLLNLVKKEHSKFRELPLRVYFALLDLSAALSRLQIDDVRLFGSYAKLIYTDNSDIDIALIMKKKDEKHNRVIKKTAAAIEEKYGKKMELHFFEKQDLKKSDPLMKEIKRNSIHLLGR